MTPKEKAEKLVDNYLTASFGVMEEYIPVPMVLAKQCALIAVDEIFQFMKMNDDYTETASNANSIWVNYFIEVKQEIEKL